MPNSLEQVRDNPPTMTPLEPERLGSLYRAIVIPPFFEIVFDEWLQHVVQGEIGIYHPPPTLALPGRPTFVTDVDSLVGCSDATSIGMRVELASEDIAFCQRYGCAVVEFAYASWMRIAFPEPYLSDTRGVTSGGAREWIISPDTPVHINPSMRITLYIQGREKPFPFPLPVSMREVQQAEVLLQFMPQFRDLSEDL